MDCNEHRVLNKCLILKKITVTYIRFFTNAPCSPTIVPVYMGNDAYSKEHSPSTKSYVECLNLSMRCAKDVLCMYFTRKTSKLNYIHLKLLFGSLVQTLQFFLVK